MDDENRSLSIFDAAEKDKENSRDHFVLSKQIVVMPN